MEAPEGLQAGQVVDAVGRRIPLTEYELGSYETAPGKPRYATMLRFATIPAVFAGWLVKSRGKWILTDAGRQAFRDLADPQAFYAKATAIYYERRQEAPDSALHELARKESGASSAVAPPSSPVLVLEEAEENAWKELQEHVRRMEPYAVQDLVAGLLQGMGYHVNWKSPPGPDKGVDILAFRDPLGAQAPRLKVQVKRRNDTAVDRDSLLAFHSNLGPDEVGIYVSTGGFTSQAQNEARSPSRRITLVDLDTLIDLWIENYQRIPPTERKLLPLQPIYFLAVGG